MKSETLRNIYCTRATCWEHKIWTYEGFIVLVGSVRNTRKFRRSF